MRSLFAFIATFALCATLFAVPSQAQSNSLSVTLDLANLPQTITLCRDPTAIQALGGIDEQWLAAIDVDNNPATPSGTYAIAGVDVLLVAETLPQQSSCSPTNGNTSTSILAGVFVWDSTQQNYIQSSASVDLNFDFAAHTMTMTAPMTGALANLKGAAPIYVATSGSYTMTPSSPTNAYDNGSPFSPSTSMTDPAGDVSGCSSPCGTGASWYGLIDLVGASATTTQQLPAFGGNTLYFEFDLASLPATVDLCRYPQVFATNGGSDSQWLALSDVDNNSGTGAGGFDAIIAVETTPQSAGCTTHSAPFAQSLSAELDRFDSTTQNFVKVGSLPVTVDIAGGKIIVQADRSVSPLTGISAQSPTGMETTGVYYPAPPTYPGAYDVSGAFALGKSFTDPTGDVQACTSPCLTSASWYPQIDLVGGSLMATNEIFGNGFEP